MTPAPPRNRSSPPSSSVKVPSNPDSFLTELTAMFERTTESGSVWVTMKRSSMMAKVHRNKLKSADKPIDYRCLIRATDGKKTISTTLCEDLSMGYSSENGERKFPFSMSIPPEALNGLSASLNLVAVGPKEQQRFQASYATILKARMTSLKKRERKDKRKATDAEKKPECSKKKASSSKSS